MRVNTRRELFKSFGLALLLLFSWALLLYWQGSISFAGLQDNLLLALQFDFHVIENVYKSLILGLIIFFTVVPSVLALAIWFALPLENYGDWKEAIQLLPAFLSGQDLAVIKLSKGEQIGAIEGLAKARKRSIFQLDAASAAVLRKGSSLTRAIGPGFHIGAIRELYSGGLDLRIQRRSLGPKQGEDPFLARTKQEDEASYLSRKSRREESTALSKDGIEIVPRIEVLFQLEGRRGSDKRPFPFQSEFAWRALANEGVSSGPPSDLRRKQIRWDWIPSTLAVDLWRIFLRKYTLQELFEERSDIAGNGQQTGLQAIETSINDRLENALVVSEKGKQNSPEYQFLRGRGIRVLKASIRNIHIDPRKEESRLINEWSEDWEMKAIQKSFQESEVTEKGKSDGLQQAASQFIKMVSTDLIERLAITDGEIILPPDEHESARLLISSTLRSASQDVLFDDVMLADLRNLDRLLNNGKNGN